MAENLLKTPLPSPWSYAVTDDGRIFFIDEERRITTWLHPIMNRPLQTGHFTSPDLPPTWEINYTPDGRKYFIDHFNQLTCFEDPRNPGQVQFADPLEDPQNNFMRDAPGDHARGSKRLLRSSSKRKSLRRKSTGSIPDAKRNYDAPVTKRGWLQKQESGIVKQWKKRWCVISELCLFCYDGVDEMEATTSVILPGYQIDECNKADGVNQKFSFKIQHENTKVLYFAASTDDEMVEWIEALRLAARPQLEDRSQFEATPASSRRLDVEANPGPQGSGNWNNESHAPHRLQQDNRLNDNRNHQQQNGAYLQPQFSARNPNYAPGINNGNYKPIDRWQDPAQTHIKNQGEPYTPRIQREEPNYGADPLRRDPRNPGSENPLYSSVRRNDQPNLNKSFSSMGSNGQRDLEFNSTWRNPGGNARVGSGSGQYRWGDASGEGQDPSSNRRLDNLVCVKVPAQGHVDGTKLIRRESSRNPRDGNIRKSADMSNSGVPLYHRPEYNHEAGVKRLDMNDGLDQIAGSVNHDRSINHEIRAQPPQQQRRLDEVDSRGPLRDGIQSSNQRQPSVSRPVENGNKLREPSISGGGKPLRQQPPPAASPVLAHRGADRQMGNRGIEAIKEDPDMADNDVLTTRTLEDLQKHLSGHTRLRLSISTNDLMGKSHEELTLLLIQLRRSQTKLEQMRNWARERLRDNTPGQTQDYKQQLRKHTDEVEKQLEITQPLINLLDNMVTMGSLFGGDNALYASQYKRNGQQPNQTAPSKKMLDFSRRHQEEQLAARQEKSLAQLTEDQVDLEQKLQQLHALDSLLQQRSVNVTLLQEDKVTLDKALDNIIRQIEFERDPVTIQRLQQQRQIIESELSNIRQQLAEASKLVEETNVENAKVEQQVIMLRSKVYGMTKSQSTPSLVPGIGQERDKLEEELKQVQSMINGLSSQGGKISKTVENLKSSVGGGNGEPRSKNYPTYLETDVDTHITRDIAKRNTSAHLKGQGLAPLSINKPRDSSGSNFVAYEYGSEGIQFRSTQPLTPKLTTTWQRSKSIDESNAASNAARILESGPISPADKTRYSVREVKKREMSRKEPDAYPVGNLQRSTSMPRVSVEPRPGYLTSDVVFGRRSTEDLFSPNNPLYRRNTGRAPATAGVQLSATEKLFPNSSSNSYQSDRQQQQQRDQLASNYELHRPQYQQQQQQQQKPLQQQRQPYEQYQQPKQQIQQQQQQQPYEKYRPLQQNPYQQWKEPASAGFLGYPRDLNQSSEMPKYVAVATVRPVPTAGNVSSSPSLMGDANNRITQNLKTQEFYEIPGNNFDANIIDRELQRPEPVEIPERYAADLDDSDDVFLTQEERLQKQDRSEQIRRMLASQSLQEFKPEELTLRHGDIRYQLNDEKRRREQILDVKQQLAEQVKQKSKEQAAQRRLNSPNNNSGYWQMS